MSDSLDRRTLLKGAAVAAVAMSSIGEAGAAFPDGLGYGEPVAFSYDLLKAQAREKAHAPYVAPPHPAPEVVQKINYEEWGKIRYRSDHALFADGPGRFPVEFFHLGLFFQKAVDFHVIDGDQSKRIVYDQSYFDMPADSVARQLPQGAGFAGFRIQESREGPLDWRKNDWVAFLGAAYFRAIGELRQYGQSSRGIALDIAVPDRPEEFPDFTEFYIDSKEGADTVLLYALMEGPSIVGVYRFTMQRGKGVVMDIEATLFMRAAVSRFGIAPLTSMYCSRRRRRRRRSIGAPRCTIPTAFRCGPATASGFGARSTIRRESWSPPSPTIIPAASAFVSATASSTTISTASITIAARPCGWNRCRALAARAGARDRSNSAKFRPTTKFTTMSWRCGCPKSPFRPTRS